MRCAAVEAWDGWEKWEKCEEARSINLASTHHLHQFQRLTSRPFGQTEQMTFDRAKS